MAEIRHAARVVVRNPEGQFLLIHTTKKGRNRWECPGGKVDPEETPARAAERELWEETGITCVGDLIPMYETRPHGMDGDQWIVHFFFAPTYVGQAWVKEPTKADKVGFFSLETMDELPTLPALSIRPCEFLIKLSEEPWNQPNDNGEKPGDICCQRAIGGRCYEHNPQNYKGGKLK